MYNFLVSLKTLLWRTKRKIQSNIQMELKVCRVGLEPVSFGSQNGTVESI